MPRELIYKDEARKAILQTNSTFAYCINNIKPVDAVEVVHGRWDKRKDYELVGYDTRGNIQCRNVQSYYCTKCGQNASVKSNYCPNCGAKMDGGNEDGK